MKDFYESFPSRKLNRGDVLHSAGEIPEYLFYLQSGHVRRFINSLEGRELTIHIFDSGAIFPLSWGINDDIPDFSLVALTDCKVNLVPREDFLKFIMDNPYELLEITKRMTHGVEGLAKRVEILSLEKANTRVSSTISYLAKHFGQKLPFTHEDIAALTGLSRERVSIELKKLKDNNDISYKRGEIVMNITDK